MGRHRVGRSLSALAATALAIVLLLGPGITEGTLPRTVYTHLFPPYSTLPGTAAWVRGTVNSTGCGGSVVAHRPIGFNATSGRPRFNVTVNVSACGNASGMLVVRDQLGESRIPVNVSVAGNYSVRANWNIGFWMLFNPTAPLSNRTFEWAEAKAWLVIAVFDPITGGIHRAVSGVTRENTSRGWLGGFAGWNEMIRVHFHLKPGPTYLVTSYIEFGLRAYEATSAPKGSFQSVSINTVGHTELRSISVTQP